MTELLSTIMAIAITVAVCSFLVISQVKFDEAQDKKEKIKADRLKLWLNKCAEARRNDRN